MLRTMRQVRIAAANEHPSRILGKRRVTRMNAAPSKETATAKKGLMDSISMSYTLVNYKILTGLKGLNFTPDRFNQGLSCFILYILSKIRSFVLRNICRDSGPHFFRLNRDFTTQTLNKGYDSQHLGFRKSNRWFVDDRHLSRKGFCLPHHIIL